MHVVSEYKDLKMILIPVLNDLLFNCSVFLDVIWSVAKEWFVLKSVFGPAYIGWVF